jgi:glycosyltransferase involved in cell wall biosynthesis
VGKNYSGGIEAHIMNLAENLAHMGHTILFLTGAIPGAKKTCCKNRIRFKRVDWLGLVSKAWNPYKLTVRRQLLFFLAALKELLRVRHETFDIVHGHIYMSGLLAYLFGKIKKIPSINTIHGSYYDVWDFIEKNPLKSMLFRIMEKLLSSFLARHCSYQIHADTNFAKKVKSWTGNHKKIKTILNGVNLTRFSPNIEPIEELKGECPVIMTVRRLVPKNGVRFLLEAIPLILKTKDIKTVIVGDGPEREKLVKLSSELKVSKNVIFVGGISNYRVPIYLSAADVVVVPSIVEASSISVLEAMAMEKPIVATGIPGITDVASNGLTSYLVSSGSPNELAQAVLFLLDNPSYGKKLGTTARSAVEKRHSWTSIAKEIAVLYKRAILEQRII